MNEEWNDDFMQTNMYVQLIKSHLFANGCQGGKGISTCVDSKLFMFQWILLDNKMQLVFQKEKGKNDVIHFQRETTNNQPLIRSISLLCSPFVLPPFRSLVLFFQRWFSECWRKVMSMSHTQSLTMRQKNRRNTKRRRFLFFSNKTVLFLEQMIESRHCELLSILSLGKQKSPRLLNDCFGNEWN